jgi:bifunctional DNase/RNase
MTLMQLREVTCCPEHRKGIIVLENLGQGLTFAFAADPEEARRLARVLGSDRSTCPPIYDFIEGMVEAFQATVTRVVLDDPTEKGLTGFVAFQRSGAELTISCYATDALALAVRARAPIYVTARTLAHVARPFRPLTARDAEEDVTAWLEQVRPEDFHVHQDDRT